MPKGGPRNEYPVLTEDEQAAFWILANINDVVECWEWRPGPGQKYGSFSVVRDGMRTKYAAHRLAFIAFYGLIPIDLVVDHRCQNKRCINPLHMEAVTDGVNLMRGTNPAAINNQKTHCLRGHEFDEENTYHPPNRRQRQCKRCNLLRQAKYDKNRRTRGSS